MKREYTKYSTFDQINGNHRFKSAVPDGFVEYQVRSRKGGRVSYFNFALAKEMGLLPVDHPEKVDSALELKLLHTFSLIIINEYDILNKRRFPKDEVRPNRYMATRYLQLQHRNKQGRTSGDGRSIWNGEFRKKGTTWDISSSGTGATRLSPACALDGKFFRSGDPDAEYGDGYSSTDEGLSAALMSEIFHQNGIGTERVLLIISFPAGSAINVRVAKSLLRPSHFLCHLKQGNYESLKNSVDFFIDRQIENGEWPSHLRGSSKTKRYTYFANQMALTFSKMMALFESHYIFCWLDWDGDNVLTEGGIIDYGSVRQFGLYHENYRYDDTDRYSTSISEQRTKGRRLVQVFAQMRSYLISGRKSPLADFSNDSILNEFDKNFTEVWNDALLKRAGLSEKQRSYLMENHFETVNRFGVHYRYFERAQSSRGIRKVADGITSDAIFSMADLLRELPKVFAINSELIDSQHFVELMRSSYAKKRDLRLTPYRVKKIIAFQEGYCHLIQLITDHFQAGNNPGFWVEIGMRASELNIYNRVTGDGVLTVVEKLMKSKNLFRSNRFYQVFRKLVEERALIAAQKGGNPRTIVGRFTVKGCQLIQEYAQSI